VVDHYSHRAASVTGSADPRLAPENANRVHSRYSHPIPICLVCYQILIEAEGHMDFTELEKNIFALIEEQKRGPKYLQWLFIKTSRRLLLLDVEGII
jgi:hypothetical protein